MASKAEAIQPQPDEKLVQVFGTQQEPEALVVQSLLNSAGVEALLLSTDSPQDILAGVGGFIVKVREEQVADAERVLAEYETEDATVSEEAEDEWEATPHDPKP